MGMAYIRKNLSPEERSEIARMNAAKRKKFGGGRKPGTGYKGPNNTPRMLQKKATMQILDEDCQVFKRFAHIRCASLIDAMHVIAETLKRQIPALNDDPSGKSFRI